MSSLLTIQQVAELLSVEPRAVRKWIKDGKIAAIKLPNGDWRMRPENLENWINKRSIKVSS